MAPKFNKRGGVKQRLGIGRGALAKRSRTDIGEFLVESHLSGALSSHQLREGARAAGESAGGLATLVTASMDKTRTRKGKTKPDTRGDKRMVLRFLRKKSKLYPPMRCEIPMWDVASNKQVMTPMNVYPPHETLHALVPEGRESEWASFDETQQGFRQSLADWSTRTGTNLHGFWMCLALWGDSAPHTKKDSLYLLTYRVLNGTRRRRVWIAALSKRSLCRCGCFGRHTFDGLFGVLAWSMKALASGVWPHRNHLNQPFSKDDWRSGWAKQDMRFRGAVIAKNGDWAWHKQTLGMRGWQERHLCWLCTATLYDRDFTANGLRRLNARTMSAFLASAYSGTQYLSKLFTVPGFVLDYILPDFMHTVCLGVLQYLMGNVFWFCFRKLDGTFARHKEACTVLLSMLNLVAAELGLEKPLADLVVTMFRPAMNKKPRMRLKAAEGRALLPIMTTMLGRYFPNENEREEMQFQCCQAMCRVYYELRNWGPSSPTRLELAARHHLLLYVQLSDGEPEGSVLWHLYPKHHLFVHVARSQTNPALLWNYADEDEIGRAVRQAKACNPKWLHTSLLERYRVL